MAGILAFLAQNAKTRVFCFANVDLRKEQQNDEILRFIEFWKQHTGHYPEELIFDSKLTTYNNLNRLNQMGISFLTLRRCSKKNGPWSNRLMTNRYRLGVASNGKASPGSISPSESWSENPPEVLSWKKSANW